MARLAGTSTGQGVYAFLLEREEQQIARFGRDMVCEDGAVFHWPRYRIDALRAGEPVEVKASMLPRWAREGVDCRWWLRAVVHPDDSIRYVEDDGSRWLAENGL